MPARWRRSVRRACGPCSNGLSSRGWHRVIALRGSKRPLTCRWPSGASGAGSHDLALEALWAQARRADPGLALSVSYVGSLDGLLALLHGEALLAGAHILD